MISEADMCLKMSFPDEISPNITDISANYDIIGHQSDEMWPIIDIFPKSCSKVGFIATFKLKSLNNGFISGLIYHKVRIMTSLTINK